ncbi:MAG: zinc-ribbon domain containing protein [Clostridia bacterium]|nr:zinc-ribbon domain containing protein [Clostridia bacterium]
MYQDKTLICKDCGKEFVFSAGEQEFYAEKGFEHEPTRCKECRTARKSANKPLFDAVCSRCGKECKVRFEPTPGRDVYCDECFKEIRANR